MPLYNYIVKKKDSTTLKGVEEAPSSKELISNLRSKGYFIISVQKQKSKDEKKGFSLFQKKRGKRSSVKLSDLTFFARNLATTLGSGVTLLRSLEIISYQTESKKFEKVLKEIAKQIRAGLTFGEAVEKYPAIFSSLWKGIIKVGESSGNLPFVLNRLADYLEMRMEFERKITSALVYPVILLLASFAGMVVFFKWILPQFIPIFAQFDIELPFLTKILFDISNFFSNNLVFLGFLVGLGLLIYVLFKKKDALKNFWDRVCFKIPLLGQIMTNFYLERFTSTLYILLDSGLPIVYTLEVAASSIGNIVLQKSILDVKEKVRTGASLSDELRKIEIFPLLISEMTKIGEETGTMSEVFQKTSDYYRKELTSRIERIIAAFEPLMIIFMGVIIGIIVISLFMPLFKLSTLGG